MIDTTVLLAAHGAGDGSTSNLCVRKLADSLKNTLACVEVICAFRKGTPSFAAAMDAITTRHAVVIPIMTSEGYFSRHVLPGEFAASLRYAELNLAITQALGMHPKMIDVVESIFSDACFEHALSPNGTTLVVVGHGTRRHVHSRSRTVEIAEIVAYRHDNWDVRSAFIDEPPFVSDVAASLHGRHIVAVPFLIGKGPHASVDIPEQLGIVISELNDTAPLLREIRERRIVCTQPVGTHPMILSMVQEIACSAISAATTGAI